jgi:hypothetical protein
VPGYDGWLDRHAEALAGGWKKSFETSSGIPVRPVYTPRELEEAGWDYERDAGYPGEAPWTRGFIPGGYRKALWEIEMYAGFGSAEDANKRYRYLLSKGSTGGVSIALDLPTQIGFDSDHPMARDEIGQIGVALTSLADVGSRCEPMSTVLKRSRSPENSSAQRTPSGRSRGTTGLVAVPVAFIRWRHSDGSGNRTGISIAPCNTRTMVSRDFVAVKKMM